MKFLKITTLVILILVIVYLLGPHPKTPVYSLALPQVPVNSQRLEKYVANQEAEHRLKSNNEARIIWKDSAKEKTPYSIVYLHGFTASQEEGNPIHKNIAKEFGCNLYLSRLSEHGIDTIDPLINFRTDKYWESAKQALSIGKQLGEKVILMGTSTGGSLALKLASEYPNDIYGLVLLSPNIAIFDKNAWLLNNPWGLQIARLVVGSHYLDSKDQRKTYQQYWTYHYPIEAAVELEEFLETSMTKQTFEKVKQPVLMLYYYKNEIEQDSVVRVSAMKKMFEELGTPDSLRESFAMPKTGNHVIGCYIKSHDVAGVESQIEKFMIDKLHLKARN